MADKIILDDYEQDIEDNFESLLGTDNKESELSMLKKAAAEHVKRKKSVTIRINEIDLEVMQIKASKLGVPYQTYINMLIHKDAMDGI